MVNVLKLMSVGPVGPGGGIYPIIDDVVCKVNFQKLIWRPNINGYMQLCLCLWALLGPEVGYIQLLRMLCAKYIENWFEGQIIVDICSFQQQKKLLQDLNLSFFFQPAMLSHSTIPPLYVFTELLLRHVQHPLHLAPIVVLLIDAHRSLPVARLQILKCLVNP